MNHRNNTKTGVMICNGGYVTVNEDSNKIWVTDKDMGTIALHTTRHHPQEHERVHQQTERHEEDGGYNRDPGFVRPRTGSNDAHGRSGLVNTTKGVAGGLNVVDLDLVGLDTSTKIHSIARVDMKTFSDNGPYRATDAAEIIALPAYYHKAVGCRRLYQKLFTNVPSVLVNKNTNTSVSINIYVDANTQYTSKNIYINEKNNKVCARRIVTNDISKTNEGKNESWAATVSNKDLNDVRIIVTTMRLLETRKVKVSRSMSENADLKARTKSLENMVREFIVKHGREHVPRRHLFGPKASPESLSVMSTAKSVVNTINLSL
ncbi:hypothetical protein FVEG_17702 [Fusarium verticillioides 7600]|uniref:Uncharacterized protein n=1 Tax=Gibberella moniliformis (strain M3125 / FGSC 7600) TaxID=334819 RepID=A0A139YC30_GIBM7|nr:hypothetical protein FVEG_17702 [Fusarium verticillioides 7600]KYG13783.1 hypothetical protein FVEG_17702 [Fusarium verticillioides 7600]